MLRTAALIAAYAGRGDLSEALAVAEGAAAKEQLPEETLLLAACCAVRLGDGERSRRIARRLTKKRLWIDGAAQWRLQNNERAKKLLTSRTGVAPGDRDRAAHVLGIVLWSEGKLDEAERLAREPASDSRGLFGALREQLLGRIELSRDRSAAATRHFERALQRYAKAGERDERLRGNLLRNISWIAVETIQLDKLSIVDIDPPPDLGKEAREDWFYVQQNRGRLLMLAGRREAALDAFVRAGTLGDGDTTRAAGALNYAAFCRTAGSMAAAAGFLEAARRHLCDRPALHDDAACALVVDFALEAYHLERASGEVVERLLSEARRRPAGVAIEGAERIFALDLTLRGALEISRGSRKDALRSLAQARQYWSRLGYRYRETITALLMHDVEEDQQHLEVAERALRPAPSSWLATEVKRRMERSQSGLGKLTSAERRVMLAICEGKTSREIAADFGRSFHTIRNQTLKVYAAMNVRTRTALVAKCARLGVAGRSAER